MEYVNQPDPPSNLAPDSYYEDELMPSQAFRKNLIQEAAHKNWPPAPTYNDHRGEEEEPEGEAAPSRGRRGRRVPRRVQDAERGAGLAIGGARGSTAPAADAEPAEGAPETAAAFFAGWREGQPVPFGAFAGYREMAGSQEEENAEVVAVRAAHSVGNSAEAAQTSETSNARSSISDLLMMPFAAFGGFSETPAEPTWAQPQIQGSHSAAGEEIWARSSKGRRAAGTSRRTPTRWTPPRRQFDEASAAAVAGHLENTKASRVAATGSTTPPRTRHEMLDFNSNEASSAPPFYAFAGEQEAAAAKGKARPGLKKAARAERSPRPAAEGGGRASAPMCPCESCVHGGTHAYSPPL